MENNKSSIILVLLMLLISCVEVYNGWHNLILEAKVAKLQDKVNHDANLIDLIETKDYRREHAKPIEPSQYTTIPQPVVTPSRFGN